MADYIIVGKSNGGLAGHASSIDTIVQVYKDGNTTEKDFHPSSQNPGQELLQYIDQNFPDAKAIITKNMQGPPGYDKRAIINDEDDIEVIISKYQKGDYDSRIKEKTLEEKPYDTPKKDGSGGGDRDNKGRNPECEDYEETGKGSGKYKKRSGSEEDNDEEQESEQQSEE